MARNPVYEKDTIDVDSIPTDGFIYRDGPWSMCANDIISAVASGGSDLMRWLPTRGVIHRTEHVAHLSWVAPEGFDGSESYMDYLAAVVVEECDFGPTADWNACEYTHTSHRVSFQSPVITRRDMGMLECENSPIYRLRGNTTGLPIDNDADWAKAKTVFLIEPHLNFTILYGDSTVNDDMMYDGIDKILDTGWVAAHAVGSGSCDFTDPMIINGTGLATPQAVLRTLKHMIRKIRNRARERGVTLTGNDMAVLMPLSHWAYLADAIAWGAMVGELVTNIVANNSIQGFMLERQRITQGGFGNGFIEVDNMAVPVLVDTLLGVNGVLEDDSVVTGDIYVLTRTFGGVNILEHQFLDWRRLRMDDGPRIEEEISGNGLFRSVWKNLNQSCFQWGIEAEARIISRFQPLQGKLTDVTVTTLLENENESASFASPDYYAYNGNQGGQDVAYLSGLGA